jgi:hypothetical protein
MKSLTTLCIAILALSSCTVTRDRCNQLYPPVTYHTVDTTILVKETIIHDTTIIANDISEMEISFEADSNNDVQVKKSITTNGHRSNISYTAERNNKVLTAQFKCNCDSLAIYHVFKDLDTSVTVNSKEVQINQVNVPAKFTWWQQFKVDYGGYSLGADLAVLLFLLGYIAWKVFSVVTPQGMAISGGFSVLGWIAKLFKR